MVRTMNWEEEFVLEKLRRLPVEKKKEVLDFLEFLEYREGAMRSLEFDEWAANLAKEKGFHHLTEEDVAKIVSDFRGEK